MQMRMVTVPSNARLRAVSGYTNCSRIFLSSRDSSVLLPVPELSAAEPAESPAAGTRTVVPADAEAGSCPEPVFCCAAVSAAAESTVPALASVLCPVPKPVLAAVVCGVAAVVWIVAVVCGATAVFCGATAVCGVAAAVIWSTVESVVWGASGEPAEVSEPVDSSAAEPAESPAAGTRTVVPADAEAGVRNKVTGGVRTISAEDVPVFRSGNTTGINNMPVCSRTVAIPAAVYRLILPEVFTAALHPDIISTGIFPGC